MAQVLEWFQCKPCGRRHRWRADIAGTQIVCPCGKMVDVPELQTFDQGRSPEDTVLDSNGTGSRTRVLEAVHDEIEPVSDFQLALERPKPQRSQSETKIRGLFGLGRTGEMVFWVLMAAVGLTAIIFAAIVVEWYYIALAVVWGPLSFWKARKAEQRWQGNRSFSKAVEETIGA